MRSAVQGPFGGFHHGWGYEDAYLALDVPAPGVYGGTACAVM